MPFELDKRRHVVQELGLDHCAEFIGGRLSVPPPKSAGDGAVTNKHGGFVLGCTEVELEIAGLDGVEVVEPLFQSESGKLRGPLQLVVIVVGKIHAVPLQVRRKDGP